MFVALDTVVVVLVIEGGIVFVDCFIVTLEGVGGLVEVLKVELLVELDIRVEVVVLIVVDMVVLAEVLEDIVESAAFMLFVLLDVGIFMLDDEIIGRRFSVVVFCKIIAEFSVVSTSSSTVITFSMSTFFSGGRFFTVIRGSKFQYGLSVSGW